MVFSRISPRALKIAVPDHNLGKLMLAAGARNAAISLLSIFSNIYVFELYVKNGYQLKTSLANLIFYILIIVLSKFVALNVSEDLSRKIGFKSTIRLSLLPFMIYLLLMILSSNYIHLVFVAAVFWGLHAGFFWWGYHGYFLKTGSRDHLGESLGEAGFLTTLATISAPLLGAFIVLFLGYNWIFVLSGLFMVVSLMILGKDHEKRQKVDVSLREVWKIVVEQKSVSLAYIGNGGEVVLYGYIWPVYLYLVFGKLTTLGLIITLANILTALVAIWLGRWADGRGESTLLKIGSPMIFVSWLARFFGSFVMLFVVSDFVRNLGEKMVTMPLNVLTYQKAFEGQSSARAILYRETVLNIGVISGLLVVLIWIMVLGNLSYWYFIPATFVLFPLIAVFKRRIK